MNSKALHLTLHCCALFGALPAFAQMPVNPLTGAPLAIEQRQRRLEELKLETQMLEEQAKQAEIKARIAGGSTFAMPRSPALTSEAPVFPAPAITPARVTASKVTMPKRDTRLSASQTRLPLAPGGVVAPPATQVTAIFRSGVARRAVVQSHGEIFTVAEGDSIRGVVVNEITDGGVTIGSVTHTLERRAAFVLTGESAAASAPGRSHNGVATQPANEAGSAWPTQFKSASPAMAIETPFATGTRSERP